jgi:ribosomal protein L18E
VSPGYPNTTEKQDSDLNLYLMMLVEDLKKEINNSLKEIQENMAKQVEDFKRKHKNPLKNYRKTLLNK